MVPSAAVPALACSTGSVVSGSTTCALTAPPESIISAALPSSTAISRPTNPMSQLQMSEFDAGWHALARCLQNYGVQNVESLTPVLDWIINMTIRVNITFRRDRRDRACRWDNERKRDERAQSL